MIVFRLTKAKYAKELSGNGAKMAGGRWNPKGFEVIYCASTSSLSILEKLVHLDPDLLPSDLHLTEIEIKDSVSKTKFNQDQLPKQWNEYPAPDQLKQVGKEWLLEAKSLILIVPSAVNPKENNILINPNHKEINHVKIILNTSFSFDNRLKK